MSVIGHTPRLHLPIYAHWSQAPWDEKRWPNFKPSEFACHATGKLAYDPEEMDKLQRFRALLGKPFFVNSGYRSPEHNATLQGAAKFSWHMEGIARDISMRNHDPRSFVRIAEDMGYVGIGQYPEAHNNFVHIDTRPGGPARWFGPSGKGF